MYKIFFLILVVMSSAVFAQTEQPPPPPPPVLFGEFETATNGYVKMRMDSFFAEFSNNPASQAYIINYGTVREIAKREKQLQNAITFRKYDASRITFVRVETREKIKTKLWIVPYGAEPPPP